jgi:hypothetical protein
MRDHVGGEFRRLSERTRTVSALIRLFWWFVELGILVLTRADFTVWTYVILARTYVILAWTYVILARTYVILAWTYVILAWTYVILAWTYVILAWTSTIIAGN